MFLMRRCCCVVQFNVLEDRFMVENLDVIGWTNEEEYTLISFNFHEGYDMRFYAFDEDANDYPVVNQTYTLDSVRFPGVFSVAVEVVKR